MTEDGHRISERFELNDEFAYVLANRHNIAGALERWGADCAISFPWRGQIPMWQGLVAEVMLQRTRAAQVAPTFCRFRRAYPTPSKFAKATEEELTELIAPLGLKWRARLLHQLAKSIDAADGDIPIDRDSLEAMPGVGPYAAAATLSLHAGRRAVIIDSNVVRVLCRLVGVGFDGETRRKRWLLEFAESMTPQRTHRNFNYAILDLASKICQPRKPLCEMCPILPWCRTGQDRSTTNG